MLSTLKMHPRCHNHGCTKLIHAKNFVTITQCGHPICIGCQNEILSKQEDQKQLNFKCSDCGHQDDIIFDL